MPHLILDILLLYNCSFMLLKIIIHSFMVSFIPFLFLFLIALLCYYSFIFVWAYNILLYCLLIFAFLAFFFFFFPSFSFLSSFNRVSYKVCFFKSLWLCKDKTKVLLVLLKDGKIHNSQIK